MKCGDVLYSNDILFFIRDMEDFFKKVCFKVYFIPLFGLEQDIIRVFHNLYDLILVLLLICLKF